ncbi:hypothetical protein COT99_02735 [Candidatus Falkowbacteria bacterium CG10_big_fil_rev_8_21_14_0_10_43_10]|uniref:Biotin carboxyl carrier protein of acetyl-CoA carboxylase n=1 Tax=Candidatus Falkowbacteria bacterium CG10_big_fil_rev_8_21_14_0_10_43_10 TaxID=1974567 RepID=A0A2H0V3S9_9BACT|nr:MAG: hypothetical protein COT99_02735 [Candidatus Falkowbacteria bacterium CG10_big_fil_rev_8_21_14_0_10_43_10]
MLSYLDQDKISALLYGRFSRKNPFPKRLVPGETKEVYRARLLRWYDEQALYVCRKREELFHNEEKAHQLIDPPENKTPAVVGEKNTKPLVFVTSPMVAQFYPKPSPTEPPFVNIGQRVMPETIVCCVETFKVYSDLKAGIAGIIRMVCVEDGATIQNGEKLIGIEPD